MKELQFIAILILILKKQIKITMWVIPFWWDIEIFQLLYLQKGSQMTGGSSTSALSKVHFLCPCINSFIDQQFKHCQVFCNIWAIAIEANICHLHSWIIPQHTVGIQCALKKKTNRPISYPYAKIFVMLDLKMYLGLLLQDELMPPMNWCHWNGKCLRLILIGHFEGTWTSKQTICAFSA